MNQLWQRPKTTRMYLQPPKSESFYTLWLEGKVVFGEIGQNITDYESMVSSGLWFLDENVRQLDFHRSSYAVRADGIPVHGLKNKLGDLDFTIECFATPKRKSSCYIKLTLKNPTVEKVCQRFGFYLRTAQERKLLSEAPDLYAPYAPDLTAWEPLPATWLKKDTFFQDGARYLTIVGDVDFCFDETCGRAMASVNLPAGGTCETVFVYSTEAPEYGSYDLQKNNTISYWEQELAKITKLPSYITKNPEKVKMIKNLTVLLLQCFCYSTDGDYLLARQGGLQRQVWTFETKSVLEALCRIGDFDDYIAPVIDAYFEKFWTLTGEVVPFGIYWAMVTANVLESFSNYALIRGEAYFQKYRAKAMQSFDWIRRTRASTPETDLLSAGLFPPMSGCDDELVFQSWCNTDTQNLFGLEAFWQACKAFADPAADAVKAELEDYKAAIRRNFERIKADQEDPSLLEIPYSPKGNNAEIGKNFLFRAGSTGILCALDADYKDIQRVLNYHLQNGIARGGLYDRMKDGVARGSAKTNLDENGICTVWYVCCHEFSWFNLFMKHGKLDKCAEILADNEKYAMTDEYYMLERYNSRNPYFAPWLPNASANGRTILMMLDYYEKA